MAAAYLINHTPSNVLGGCTPFEVLFGKTPKYSNIKAFWCVVYAKRQGIKKDKFYKRA